MMFAINKKIPQWWQPPGELVIRVHLPINCSICDRHKPDKIFLILKEQKKSPSWCEPARGVSYQGASTN
ncbi:MAG: hypothetical protein KAF91_15495 [Nostoc sp. TH1S01]|nr:hypothetical protein [Nostoc sp. TH1S01]